VVYNSSLIKRALRRDDVVGIPVPTNDIAAELGNPRVINMVALGALIRALGVLPLEGIVAALAEELEERGRGNLLEVNRRALERGYEEAGRVLGG